MKYLYLIAFLLMFSLGALAQATLIGHWDFNGTTNDVTGNGLNGTGVNLTSAAGFSGAPNTAYAFNGTSSKIDVPYNPLMNLSSWSITALIKPQGYYTGSCQANYILSRGHEYSNDYYALYFLDNPYDLSCGLFTPDSEVVEAMPAGNSIAYSPQFRSGQFVHLNTWYCIASTYANDTIRVYINGNFAVAVQWSNQYGPGSTAGMSMGYYNYGLPNYPYYYNGILDDVKLYSGALSQAQLDSLCAAMETIDTFLVYDFIDTTICSSATFTAQHVSGNVASTYLWFFGDNTTGNANPATHSYTLPGTYNVKLVTTDILGNTDTVIHQVTVIAPNFNYGIIDTIHNCHTVQLTADYLNGDMASQFTWVYGDNTPNGSGSTTTHTYSQDGNYTDSLIVTNNAGCIDTFTLPITLGSNLNYSIADSQVNCKTIKLTAGYITGDTALQYSWFFSDNTTAIGNPVMHTFPQSGVHSASVVLTNKIGCTDTFTHTFVLTTNITYSIADSTVNCKTAKLSATHTAGDIATQFLWLFDDNTTATGNPATHVFTQSGNHNTTLVVTNAQGCTDTFTHALTLSTNFNYSIADSPINCRSAKLLATYTNGEIATQFLWLFDDNTSATGNPVTHLFPVQGTHNVTLVVTGAQGCTDTFTHSLTLVSDINYTLTDSVINCKTIDLQANYQGGDIGAQFLWFFSDNTSASGNPLSHMFSQNGAYMASLVVVDGQGCTDTVSHSFTLPVDIQYSIADSGIDCKTARLTATYLAGDTAAQLIWLFPGNDTASANPITHTFQHTGANTAGLVLINDIGCRDTTSYDFTIIYQLYADFTFDPVTPEKNKPLHFYNTSSPEAIKFSWDFGDSTHSAEENPVKQYNNTGTYEACLTVTDSSDCSASVCKNVQADVSEYIDIPGAFSPNGDDINDLLFARGFDVASMSLTIYDRWGQKIFTGAKMDLGWDGTYKGKPQPDEVYAYVLDAIFISGKTFHKQGNVTILR